MKSNIKILFLAATILCSTTVWAQEAADIAMQNLKEALSQGDCDRAQRAYNAWKAYTEKTDGNIEVKLKECKGTESIDVLNSKINVLRAENEVLSKRPEMIEPLSEIAVPIGVVINGVRWATCNVDNPGTFAANPESAGKFYQWNRKKAWATTGKTVSGWGNYTPSGNSWTKANDPSPAGWRVPTSDEFDSLWDETKVKNERITSNGIFGIKFTDKATGNSIFLPAAGYRNYSGRVVHYDGSYGYYWSSTVTTLQRVLPGLR